MDDRELSKTLMAKNKEMFRQQLIGQKEGLVIALDIAKTQVKTLENMIKTVDKSLIGLEV